MWLRRRPRLRRRGHDVRCIDLSVEQWDPGARRLGRPGRVLGADAHGDPARALPGSRADGAPSPICFYGLYARTATAVDVADRVDRRRVRAVARGAGSRARTDGTDEPEIQLGRDAAAFELPARDLLPPLDRYAHLALGGEERAGRLRRGLARLRAPLPPLPGPGGLRRPHQRSSAQDTVLADVAQLVPLGARHITFGDPDFLNGVAPLAARRAGDARALPRAHLRLHRQGRAHPAPRSIWGELADARLPVRRLRLRVA